MSFDAPLTGTQFVWQKNIANSTVKVCTSYATDNPQITSVPVDSEIVRKMGDFWPEEVGADTE